MDQSSENYIELAGKVFDYTHAESETVSEFIERLQSGLLPSVHFVEYRQIETGEIVIFDIEPEVPQHPAHPVLPSERVAAIFNKNEKIPDTFLLRKDFPKVPHLSFYRRGFPLQVCLTEASKAEEGRSWTPSYYIRLIHNWLRLTARGELHEDDQPLEPVLLGHANRIILPSGFYDTQNESKNLKIYLGGQTNKQITYVAVSNENFQAWAHSLQPVDFSCFIYTTKPIAQRATRIQPETLSDLDELLSDENFLNELRQYLQFLDNNAPQLLFFPTLFFIRIPKQREVNGPVESVETSVFAANENGREIGEKIGIWQIFGGELGGLVPHDLSKTGNDVFLEPLIPTVALTPESAAILNNVKDLSEKHLMGVGVGALGSQLVNNLNRTGINQWTLIDEDVLLGHNLARHYLPGFFAGTPKAQSLATLLNTTYSKETIVPIVADILTQPLGAWSEKQVDAIVDCSASVAVGRYLAQDQSINAKRISLFLNPGGTDFVILAESEDRSFRLDFLEMDYYRGIVQTEALHKHLLYNGQPIRYSYACRDISSQLPQDQAALFSAVGARAVRHLLDSPDAQIKVWLSAEDLTITSLTVSPTVYEEVRCNKWILYVSSHAKEAIAAWRLQRLPNETGGVLIGSFDMDRKFVYVVDIIPSPSDSQEWPTAYIRGIKGLPERLKFIHDVTAGNLMYLGEWHSHPEGCATSPSNDDRIVFDWLKEHRLPDGFPPLMAIAGDNNISWYIEEL